MLSDSRVSATIRPVDKLLVGNWMNEAFNQSLGHYDTILADYLIGAVDGFSPYEQDTIIKRYNLIFLFLFRLIEFNIFFCFHRLSEHLSPEGRLYFIGMNPIPDESYPPTNIISEIRRARDACILLAGHKPYR
jgi:hypothetical protein